MKLKTQNSKLRTHSDDPVITAAEAAAMQASDSKQRRMTPEDALAYNEYCKDWAQRMTTFTILQKEYMGPRRLSVR
jgi:hypothetical protein